MPILAKKPTKRQIEQLAAIIGDVEIVKHFDADSIAKTIGSATILAVEEENNEELTNAAKYVNSKFNSPWRLLAAAGEARDIPCAMRSEQQAALLSAIEIIAKHDADECAQYGIDSVMHNTCYNIQYKILM